MSKPIRAPEPEFSPLPKPRKDDRDERLRPLAAVMFKALKDAGDDGLSWAEAWALTDGTEQTGVVVTWMRQKGVSVVAFYEGGMTRFRLE